MTVGRVMQDDVADGWALAHGKGQGLQVISRTLGLALVLAVFCLPGSEASAQEPIQTERQSCQSLQGLVRSNGHATLRSGSNIFERYVRDQSACLPGQAVQPRWTPSADQAQCFVGYSCIERDHKGSRG